MGGHDLHFRGLMNRTLLIAAAFAALATSAAAQPGPAGQRPKLDANGDGRVTLSEFKAAQDARAQRLFARLDGNGDGRITAAEAQAGRREGGPRGRRGPGLMALDSDRDGAVSAAEFAAGSSQRFARLDADKDGRITATEAAARHDHMGRRGGGHRGDMVARLDADRDGAVTKAELAARAEQRFRSADANKDGWLSPEELGGMRQKARARAGA